VDSRVSEVDSQRPTKRARERNEADPRMGLHALAQGKKTRGGAGRGSYSKTKAGSRSDHPSGAPGPRAGRLLS
jgi:hypothetical protein